jgi:lipopolysaccharide transport system ATP-binding protein
MVTFPANGQTPSITCIEVDPVEAKIGNLVIKIDYISPIIINQIIPGILLRAENGDPVYGSNLRIHPSKKDLSGARAGSILFRANNIPIQPGRYILSVWLGEWHVDHDSKTDALTFEFKEGHKHPLAPSSAYLGYLDVRGEWG